MDITNGLMINIYTNSTAGGNPVDKEQTFKFDTLAYTNIQN